MVNNTRLLETVAMTIKILFKNSCYFNVCSKADMSRLNLPA